MYSDMVHLKKSMDMGNLFGVNVLSFDSGTLLVEEG